MANAIYSDAFKALHKRTMPLVNIEYFNQVATENIPAFREPASRYATAPVYIKLCDKVNGTMMLSVVPWDTDWYTDLCSALCEMTGERSVQVVDLAGAPIGGMTHSQLSRLGEVDVVTALGRRPIRLGSVPVPPERMSTNKCGRIAEWFEGVQRTLPDEIAAMLSGSSPEEIDRDMRGGGALDTMIQSSIETPKWPSLLSTYGMDKTARTASPVGVAREVSHAILSSLRNAMRANQHEIRAHYVQTQNRKLGSESVWAHEQHRAEAPPPTEECINDHDLYREIAEAALYRSSLSDMAVYIVHKGRTPDTGTAASAAQSTVADGLPRTRDADTQYRHYAYYTGLPMPIEFHQDAPANTNASIGAMPGLAPLRCEAPEEPAEPAAHASIGAMPGLAPFRREAPEEPEEPAVRANVGAMPGLIPAAQKQSYLDAPTARKMPALVYAPVQRLDPRMERGLKKNTAEVAQPRVWRKLSDYIKREQEK